MIQSTCLCQSIKFEFQLDNNNIYVCHCSVCRKSNGSHGVSVVLVSKQNFKWLEGKDKIKCWANSKATWLKNFCADCGSPLPAINDDENMYIPAGLISDAQTKLKVAHHLWTNSKASWHIIGDNGKCHNTEFNN